MLHNAVLYEFCKDNGIRMLLFCALLVMIYYFAMVVFYLLPYFKSYHQIVELLARAKANYRREVKKGSRIELFETTYHYPVE